jgi:hypothetical protein
MQADRSGGQATAGQEIGDGGFKEGHGAFFLFVGQDLAEGDAGVIIDAIMDVFPAVAAGVAVAGAAGLVYLT